MPEPARLLVARGAGVSSAGLGRRLEQLGYTVVQAEGGPQALELLNGELFDLALLDVRLMEMSGFQLPAHLKAEGGLNHVPVIVLAQADEIERATKCIEMGAEDYLLEPIDPVPLKARVGASLEEHRLRAREQAFLERKEVVRFERDLHIAREIQASFLPEALPQPPGWEIAARFQPAREVAGDFYDVFPLVNGRRLGIVVADVCDKGVGAALFMALFRSLIRAFAEQHYALRWMDAVSDDWLAADPAERRRTIPSTGTTALKNAVLLTNNYIARTHEQAIMFATIFFGVLDPATGVLAYVNGGQEPAVIVGPAGVKTRLTPTGPAIGLFPDIRFEIGEAHLEPGESLVAFTDGVTEAEGLSGELFTSARVHALLAQPSASATELLDRIETSVHVHTASAEPSDDITMLAVRRVPVLDR